MNDFFGQEQEPETIIFFSGAGADAYLAGSAALHSLDVGLIGDGKNIPGELPGPYRIPSRSGRK